MGVDNGGVYRDALSAFWDGFYDGCTICENERVPYITHDYQSEEWSAVARIIVRGFKDISFFPFRVSKCVIATAIFGEEQVTSKMLLESFKSNVSEDERKSIDAAISFAFTGEQRDELRHPNDYKCMCNVNSLYLRVMPVLD